MTHCYVKISCEKKESAPKETICEKIRVSTRVISELRRFLKKKMKKKKKNFEIFKFTRFAYRLFTGVLGYFERTNR